MGLFDVVGDSPSGEDLCGTSAIPSCYDDNWPRGTTVRQNLDVTATWNPLINGKSFLRCVFWFQVWNLVGVSW